MHYRKVAYLIINKILLDIYYIKYFLFILRTTVLLFNRLVPICDNTKIKSLYSAYIYIKTVII